MLEDLQISKNAGLVAIHRLTLQGELISPAKGFYVIVPPEHQSQGCIPAEELVPLLMHHLKAEYYVALLSAAQYHGAAHQKPGRFQIISNMRTKHPLRFGNVQLELIHKKNLNELPIQNIAVKTGYLKVASPELTAMDLLNYSLRSGGLNHIATVLSELIEVMDPEKLIKLAEASGEKAWLQRLGYILEQIDTMDPEKNVILTNAIKYYLKDRLHDYIRLASDMPKAGYERNKKWMIIVNTSIESDL
jgi:predicted transcriptional regulator of viral defense system